MPADRGALMVCPQCYKLLVRDLDAYPILRAYNKPQHQESESRFWVKLIKVCVGCAAAGVLMNLLNQAYGPTRLTVSLQLLLFSVSIIATGVLAIMYANWAWEDHAITMGGSAPAWGGGLVLLILVLVIFPAFLTLAEGIVVLLGIVPLQDPGMVKASAAGDLAEVDRLLAHGVDPNTKDTFHYIPMPWSGTGRTALHMAAANGRTEVVALLLARGGHIDAEDHDEYTPLHCALFNGQVEVATFLLERGAKHSVEIAAGLGQLADVQEYLTSNGDVNADCPGGSKPLHWAAKNGRTQVARLLLEHQADVDASDAKRRTPLHWASVGGHPEVMQLLLRHNALVNSPDHLGETPLHLAASDGHVAAAMVLFENGAEVNGTTSLATTPLHRAAENGHTEVASLLLKHGAAINAEEAGGSTPLRLAGVHHHTQLAELLRNHGGVVR